MLKDTKLIRGATWPASFLLSLIDLRVIGALKGGEGVPPLQSRLPGHRNAADSAESPGASGIAALALLLASI